MCCECARCWWWKWSRGVDGRWCQQLCSAVVLCIGCQQVAAQAKAEHTSLPPALPDHYWLLVLVNIRRYTQKHAHKYIYTAHTIHTQMFVQAISARMNNVHWTSIWPYDILHILGKITNTLKGQITPMYRYLYWVMYAPPEIGEPLSKIWLAICTYIEFMSMEIPAKRLLKVSGRAGISVSFMGNWWNIEYQQINLWRAYWQKSPPHMKRLHIVD